MPNKDRDSESKAGEHIDEVSRDPIKLAYDLLERFPDLVRRHKVIAGGAAISSSLIILAGVAISRRMRKGQTAEQALADLTEEELTRLDPRRINNNGDSDA